MLFCEECGGKLIPGNIFCENCGAAIPTSRLQSAKTSDSENADISVFSNANWSSILKKKSSLGIILTRCKRLAEHLGVDEDLLWAEIKDYVQNSKTRGVNYHLLDLDNNVITACNRSLKDNIKILKTISSECNIDYLFILGNEEIVEIAEWEDHSADNDKSVYSDLPYVTLDTSSPYDNIDFDLSHSIKVGRLPTTRNCWSSFKNYLHNVGSHFLEQDSHSLTPYGLSALVWEQESNNEFSRISSNKVHTSPDVVGNKLQSFISSHEPTLLYFNLHGSDDDKYWYGQAGSQFPQAASPGIFEGYNKFFFLGVEACYGAKYVGLNQKESILKTALANRCLAFLGSSKIAYGTSEPTGCCADIVVGEFMERVLHNDSAGEAYIAGIKKLVQSSSMEDDADIKTLAEFALYGDPTVCRKYPGVLSKTVSSGDFPVFGTSRMKNFTSTGHINIAMPDIRKRVRLALAAVSMEIEQRIDDFVAKCVLPGFKEKPTAYQQKIYRMQNSDMMQKIYIRNHNGVYEIAKIYFDGSGSVCKVVTAK